MSQSRASAAVTPEMRRADRKRAPGTSEMCGHPADAEIVHECPPDGSGLMPCCGRTPFEVPRFHRMTVYPKLVTCGA